MPKKGTGYIVRKLRPTEWPRPPKWPRPLAHAPKNFYACVRSPPSVRGPIRGAARAPLARRSGARATRARPPSRAREAPSRVKLLRAAERCARGSSGTGCHCLAMGVPDAPPEGGKSLLDVLANSAASLDETRLRQRLPVPSLRRKSALEKKLRLLALLQGALL